MVVSFSEDQPTRYKYDQSKIPSQCDKEADIITANVYEQLKLLDNSNSKKKITTKKNKKWSPRMCSDEDENTSNTSPITGKRNTSPISSKFSSTNTSPIIRNFSTNTNFTTKSSKSSNKTTLPIRGSKKEQTIKSKKKKKKRNMLDSDSSSEEEIFI